MDAQDSRLTEGAAALACRLEERPPRRRREKEIAATTTEVEASSLVTSLATQDCMSKINATRFTSDITTGTDFLALCCLRPT
jgi:hypothetical protein